MADETNQQDENAPAEGQTDEQAEATPQSFTFQVAPVDYHVEDANSVHIAGVGEIVAGETYTATTLTRIAACDKHAHVVRGAAPEPEPEGSKTKGKGNKGGGDS